VETLKKILNNFFKRHLHGLMTIIGQWSIVVSQWSMVNGQWSMVNGQWSMVNGQWSLLICPPCAPSPNPPIRYHKYWCKKIPGDEQQNTQYPISS
jgi:hypothetical protein